VIRSKGSGLYFQGTPILLVLILRIGLFGRILSSEKRGELGTFWGI